MSVYREVTIQIKQKEVMKKLEEMSKQGVNLTLWFYQKVLEHKVQKKKKAKSPKTLGFYFNFCNDINRIFTHALLFLCISCIHRDPNSPTISPHINKQEQREEVKMNTLYLLITSTLVILCKVNFLLSTIILVLRWIKILIEN